MPSADPIVVVGVGGRTCLGVDLPSSVAAWRAGISGYQEHPYLVDSFLEPMVVAYDTTFDLAVTGHNRAIELGVSAAVDALRPLTADGYGQVPISFLLSTSETRPGLIENFSVSVHAATATRLQAVAAIKGGGSIAGGHAGGLLAMLHASRTLREGSTKFCLVGGIETYLEAETLEWLDERDQLHSEANRFGFCPGEAAAFCLVTTLRTAREHDLVPLVELVAIAAAHEPNRIKTESVCLGEGLGEAFRLLFESAPPVGPVDRIIGDLNGERYRGNEYGFAVLRNAGRFRDAADIDTPADCWGDVGAASGPLYVGMVVEAAARGYSKGPLSMVWASSENGARAAALLGEIRGTR
jgi:3-oxoacyl-[acyl-carrier-protein] synthase-1